MTESVNQLLHKFPKHKPNYSLMTTPFFIRKVSNRDHMQQFLESKFSAKNSSCTVRKPPSSCRITFHLSKYLFVWALVQINPIMLFSTTFTP